MRTRFDQLAKSILQRALSPLGTVETQREVAGDVQYADIFFRPLPERVAMRASMGLLGRMTASPCLMEAFTGTPAATRSSTASPSFTGCAATSSVRARE